MVLWCSGQGDRLCQICPVPPVRKQSQNKFLPAALWLSPSAKAVRGGKYSFRQAILLAKLRALRSTGLPAGPRDRPASFQPVQGSSLRSLVPVPATHGLP